MTNQLKVKYGVVGAASLIVGTIIGSGIFTKTRSILTATNGNSNAAILAWVIGTICTILGVLLVNEIASKEIKTGGMQTYAEAAWGNLFGYIVGFAETFLYVPGTLVILSFYGVLQTYTILGLDPSTINVNYTTLFVGLVIIFHIIVNMYSTLLTKILSYGALVIKLIPLFMIIIFAFILKHDAKFVSGLSNSHAVIQHNDFSTLFSLATNALVSVMFAFEGWIYIGTISQEIKDAKKNVPLALIAGTGFVAVVYIGFTLASLHVIPGYVWADANATVDTGSVVRALFGPALSETLNVAILISIIGGLNGFAIISIRLPYAMAIRNQIIGSKWLSQVSEKSNIPANSGFVMLAISLLWLVFTHIFGAWVTFGKVTDIYSYYDNVMEVYMANMPVAIFWFFYCCIFVGAFVYRFKNRREVDGGFQLPLWLNIIFVIIATIGGLLVVKSCVYTSTGWDVNGLFSVGIGLIVTFASLLVKPFIKNFSKF